MADSLRLEIVTPQGVVVSDDVQLVTLPSIAGEIGVYPHHVHLVTAIEPGELVVTSSGTDRYYAVGEGLVEVTGDRVDILTDMAVAAEKIDEVKVEEARARAAARLADKLSDEEIAAVNASLARSIVQLQVHRRRRR